MASSAIVTAKTGPAVTVTTLTLSDVRSMLFDLAGKSVLSITLESGQVREFDIAASTTLTATITAGSLALTISQ